MSTEVVSGRDRDGLLTRAHRLFEIPLIFEFYQVVFDGGKRTPVSRFLEGVPYKTVVDLGCGTGAWSYLARDRYLGLDYSPSFIRGCRRRFAGEPHKRFEMGDLESIQLDETFDLALMMSVLHHLSDDQAEATLDGLSGRTARLLVMDLLPIPRNPASRLLYRLDRGNHIRSADAQLRLLLHSKKWVLEREGSFYSYNRLYRHTLFLLRSSSVATGPPLSTLEPEQRAH